jgi:hypothetical protein
MACEPAPGKMHAKFLDELALTANAVQIADQQNSQQELWIDGWTASLAIAVFKSIAYKTEVDMLIN